MAGAEKLKQSLYFAHETLREIMLEANRLDRSLSWTVQQAWRIARDEVRKFPGADRPMRVERRTPAPAPRERPAPAAPLQSERDGHERVEASSQIREFLRGKFEREP